MKSQRRLSRCFSSLRWGLSHCVKLYHVGLPVLFKFGILNIKIDHSPLCLLWLGEGEIEALTLFFLLRYKSSNNRVSKIDLALRPDLWLETLRWETQEVTRLDHRLISFVLGQVSSVGVAEFGYGIFFVDFNLGLLIGPTLLIILLGHFLLNLVHLFLLLLHCLLLDLVETCCCFRGCVLCGAPTWMIKVARLEHQFQVRRRNLHTRFWWLRRVALAHFLRKHAPDSFLLALFEFRFREFDYLWYLTHCILLSFPINFRRLLNDGLFRWELLTSCRSIVLDFLETGLSFRSATLT